MLLAMLMATWVELSGGPMMLHQSRQSGMGSGPLLRVDLGVPVNERMAAEAWVSGAMQTAPLSTPGDSAVAAAGAGGRVMLMSFGDKTSLWAHVGAGWGAPAAGNLAAGPTGFAGGLLSFQPFLQRFQVGVELDAVAYRRAFGFAALPSLRCAF